MITFTILLLIALILLAIAIIGLVTGGVAFFVVFGDLIVCVFIIIMILRWLIKRK